MLLFIILTFFYKECQHLHLLTEICFFFTFTIHFQSLILFYKAWPSNYNLLDIPRILIELRHLIQMQIINIYRDFFYWISEVIQLHIIKHLFTSQFINLWSFIVSVLTEPPLSPPMPSKARAKPTVSSITIRLDALHECRIISRTKSLLPHKIQNPVTAFILNERMKKILFKCFHESEFKK